MPQLVLGILFGSVGLGFFIYGKRHLAVSPLLCGIALMVVPMFISNSAALVVTGCCLVVLPYFWRP